MPLKIPDLFSKKTAYDFFYEFLECNASEPGFSQRALSAQLGWPVSYLPDLMKKRKAFTVKRAVEFGNHFRLGPIDFEKLIYFALFDSGLATESELERISAAKTPERQYDSKNFELLNVATFITFEAIRWLQGFATIELLKEIGAKKRFEPDVIAECVAILLKLKAVRQDGDRFSIQLDDLFADERGVEAQQLNQNINHQFALMQSQFFSADFFGPCFGNSSIVLIEKSRFNEIVDRAVAFRNWIFEISKGDAKLALEKDVRLFQFDLNITPLLNAASTLEIRGRAKSARAKDSLPAK